MNTEQIKDEFRKQGAKLISQSTRNGRFTNLAEDKLRGGYYTDPNLAAWLCSWAIRTAMDKVLEPSCGNGVFLEAITKRLKILKAKPKALSHNILGIEIVNKEANQARKKLKSTLTKDIVITTDFFAWWQENNHLQFDAIVGNPPFIRYQSFPEPYRGRAMSIMNELGLTPNRLTNIWVPFVVATAASLRENGRLAMVLPAEILQVSYASQLRSFLADRFKQINLVACNELFFEKAEQEIILLLADGALNKPSPNNTCQVKMAEAQTVSNITSSSPSAMFSKCAPKRICHDSEKWLKYFLSEQEISFMRKLRSSEVVASLGDHASIDVGIVTGKNDFFVLNDQQVLEFGVGQHTIPLVSRSMHLKGVKINKDEWQKLSSLGNKVHLLHLAPLNGSTLPRKLLTYIRLGESRDVHKGYKCSIRKPWYAVPSVWVPDAFLFRQIYDFPRAVLNNATATSTDTIHRMRCKANPQITVSNLYTHLSAASAEIEGRSYGGGVLELEPNEAERMLIPAKLCKALPVSESNRLVRAGRLDEVLIENDRLILKEQLGFSQSECAMLRNIWLKMRNRRLARRRKPTVRISESAIQ